MCVKIGKNTFYRIQVNLLEYSIWNEGFKFKSTNIKPIID